VGTSVTISGSSFDSAIANDTVQFNGVTAQVTAASPTSLTVTVPLGATTGRITVDVGGRTATSASSFTVTSSSGGDCTTPPPPSALVGWAAVAGNGVTTTTGGGSAAPVVVTTLADLSAAAKGTSPAVIYVKGVLGAGTLTIGSNKTIVGLCGAEVHGHVRLSGSVNVIVRNLKIVGYDCTDSGATSSGNCSGGLDAITVQSAAHHLWFDHVDVSDGSDGNLDIAHAADYITISWSKFHYFSARSDLGGSDSTGASGHRFSNLIGHSDSNAAEDTGHLRITFHHNWWAENVVERQPRVRFGQVHLFNNLWTSSGDNYCIGVGVGANILGENNVFAGVKTPINTTSYVDSSIAASAIKSIGNTYSSTSGPPPVDLNPGSVFSPPYSHSGALTSATSVQSDVESGAGPR
jgi:pectate lyase